MIKLYNQDCLSAMANLKDTEFDLAIVDPPYTDNFKISASDKATEVKKHYNLNSLQNDSPKKPYFDCLKRVSKNQIIWGVNYYSYYLGAGRIVWDKDNTGVYSDCELAYHSFSNVTRKFQFRWNGMLQEHMKNKEFRVHPTQKPVKLYEWLLTNYAQSGDKILDTHGGSMSIALACHNMGFDLTLFEIDKDYFEAGKARLEEHQKQQQLFKEKP